MIAQRLSPKRARPTFLTVIVAVMLAMTVTACGGGDGKRTTVKNGASPTPPSGTVGSSSGGGPSSGGIAGTPPVVNLPVAGPIDTGDPAIAAYANTVHPVLVANCARCHGDGGVANPLFVFNDIVQAHHALEQRAWVDLDLPAKSRLVTRLAVDQHACWTDCPADAQTLTNAITNWSLLLGKTPGTPPPVVAQPSDIVSAAVTSASLVATPAGAGRISTDIIALYEFRDGAGTVARDTSGVAPAADLAFTGTVNWLPTQGIEFTAGSKAMATAANSRKLTDRLSASGAYTVEVWITPGNGAITGAIVAYGQDTSNRNFAITQAQSNYQFRHRRGTASRANTAGDPAFATTTSPAQPSLQHIVVAYDRANGRRIYVNGSKIAAENAALAIANWNTAYTLALGNEGNNQASWQGQMKLVTVYERALSDNEVLQNFDAGIGMTNVLNFDVSAVTGVAGSAITMEFADFDKSAYYFGRPTFVAPGTLAAPIPLQGLRIAINGKVPVASQAFYSLKTTVDMVPFRLSRQGTVIAKDQGAGDEFSLQFEVLGAKQNIVAQPSPSAPPADNSVVLDVPDVGIRTFEQINNTMAVLTGVSPTTTAVLATYDNIRQQLPSEPDIKGFLSSQQTAIARLAFDYCDVMVESQPLRDAFFGTAPAFEFAAAPATAFSTQAKKDLVMTKLVNNMVGVNVATQPVATELTPALQTVIDGMLNGCRATATINCTSATRTRAVVKAACASVLSSAAVLIQ